VPNLPRTSGFPLKFVSLIVFELLRSPLWSSLAPMPGRSKQKHSAEGSPKSKLPVRKVGPYQTQSPEEQVSRNKAD
jgi:hypothetical protein